MDHGFKLIETLDALGKQTANVIKGIKYSIVGMFKCA